MSVLGFTEYGCHVQLGDLSLFASALLFSRSYHDCRLEMRGIHDFLPNLAPIANSHCSATSHIGKFYTSGVKLSCQKDAKYSFLLPL